MDNSKLRIIKKLKSEYQKLDNFMQAHAIKVLSDLEQQGPNKYWAEWEYYDGSRHKVIYTKSEWEQAEKEYNNNRKKYHTEIIKYGKLEQIKNVLIQAIDFRQNNKISDKYKIMLKKMKFTDTQINELDQELLQFKDDFDLYKYFSN